jgi:hypothetical protein
MSKVGMYSVNLYARRPHKFLIFPPRANKGESVVVIPEGNYIMMIDFLTRRGAMLHMHYLGHDRPRFDRSCADFTGLKCNYVCTSLKMMRCLNARSCAPVQRGPGQQSSSSRLPHY